MVEGQEGRFQPPLSRFTGAKAAQGEEGSDCVGVRRACSAVPAGGGEANTVSFC